MYIYIYYIYTIVIAYNISYAYDWSYAFSYNPHMPYVKNAENPFLPPFLDHGAHIVLSEKLLYPVISWAVRKPSYWVFDPYPYVQGLNEVSIEIPGGNVRWCKYRFGGPTYFNMQEDPSRQVGSKYTCLFSKISNSKHDNVFGGQWLSQATAEAQQGTEVAHLGPWKCHLGVLRDLVARHIIQ